MYSSALAAVFLLGRVAEVGRIGHSAGDRRDLARDWCPR